MGQGCCKDEDKYYRNSRYRLDDYQLIKCVGRGGFGKVWEVVHKRTKKTYALKIMKKLLIMNKNGHKSVMNERTILGDIDHE